ncbi:peptidoglycan editing factor PgeF [Antribacter gilvus]|uniref:peptidoglycan editing factor PgeF n=1 Tax=Antribacter gilvus TaxID=2304675 RepID=UPI001F0CB0FB|nr:peptidoglycan editing factor PgeF [Antribacter gilvus]
MTETGEDQVGIERTQGVPVLSVDLGPGVRAFFTTSAGGVSPAPWAAGRGGGLNLGLGVSDDVDRVRENRARVASAVGAPVVFVTQVHGDGVLTVGSAERDAWSAETPPTAAGDADALVTAEAGLGLGVLVADCVPVLLADPVARVVGVAHAGRKGVLAGVVLRALDAMVARGAEASRIRAVVGPAVCGRCYEVPAAMRDEVASAVPETWSTTTVGTPGLDLPAGVLSQLAARGVTAEDLGRCTVEDAALYSHRRASAAGTTTGRQAGVVTIFG